MNTIAIEDRYGLTTCNKQAIAIERGEGSYVWDEQGRRYLDFTSGWGVTALGHAHPAIVAALQGQAAKILQNPNSGFTYSPVRSRLLQRMQQILPQGLQRVFFANSGAEANDAAIKLARKITGRSVVIAISGSFHGRTLSTLSVSGGPENAARYLPKVPDNVFVALEDVEALTQAFAQHAVAAVIIEPVQGEGGVRTVSRQFFATLANLCRDNGALLIADEVQSGYCRTGSFFAVEKSGVSPDILTMGKGIAGGFPFAAFAVTESVASGVAKGDHGGTYCGNPLGCAVADAVLTHMLDHELAKQVQASGSVLTSALEKVTTPFPELVKELRSAGLLIGLQLYSDEQVQRLTQICLDNGLLVTPTRNAVLRIIPSLLVNKQEIEEGVALLQRSLAQLQNEQNFSVQALTA